MLITRATRHDKADLEALLKAHGWSDADIDEGVAFIARDGHVVGCVRLVEVAPQTIVVDDVLVAEGRRGKGIGTSLMEAAMKGRGGTMYLCCHGERIPFYERLGFREVALNDAPAPAVAYWRKVGDIPTPPDHVHHFMRAR